MQLKCITKIFDALKLYVILKIFFVAFVMRVKRTYFSLAYISCWVGKIITLNEKLKVFRPEPSSNYECICIYPNFSRSFQNKLRFT